MDDPTDDEVFRVIIDGGRKLCNYALEQWITGKYCGPYPWSEQDEKMRQGYIQHWKKINRRISELRPLLEKALKETDEYRLAGH